jgi:hypothetical protein
MRMFGLLDLGIRPSFAAIVRSPHWTIQSDRDD